jgi:hypothetical protein
MRTSSMVAGASCGFSEEGCAPQIERNRRGLRERRERS